MKRLAVATALLLPASLTLAATLAPQGRSDRAPGATPLQAPASPRDAASAQPARTNVSLPRMPSISPDGRSVVFSYHGDLWSVPTAGGNAVRLSSHPADESWSRFSPDGARIAFNSERRGSNGLFTMHADGTGVTEVLAFDRAVTLSDWARTGAGDKLLFSASLEPDVYRSPRPYVVPADGGVYKRLHGAFGRSPAQEPDGQRVLFERGGGSWDRRHYRGDTRDLWLYDPGAADEFVRLTNWKGNDGRARWAGKDKLIYTSDRADNTVNLYLMNLADGADAEKNAKRLTSYTDRDVEDFDVTPDGRVLVFARWDKLYTLDLAETSSGPRELVMTAAEDERDNIEYVTVDSRVTDAAVSPDGKTMAFVAYGQLYVRGTEDNSASRRISSTLARHKDIAWSPDGGTLYFVNDESGRDAIYAVTATRTRSEIVKNVQKFHDAKTKKDAQAKKDATTQPVQGEPASAGGSATTRPSTQPATRPTTDETRGEATPGTAPDPAKWPDAIAFNIELVSESDQGDAAPVPAPNANHLAFTRGVGDLWVLDLESGEAKRVFNGWSRGLSYTWTYDNKHLLFTTDDADFNTDIWATRADGTGWRGEGQPINITRHPLGDVSMSISYDNRVLTFASARAASSGGSEEGAPSGGYAVYRVYLDEELNGLAPVELEEYYKSLAERVKRAKVPAVPAWAKERGTVSPLSRALATRPTGEAATRAAAETATRRADRNGPSTQPATRPGARRGDDGATADAAAFSMDDLRKALRDFIMQGAEAEKPEGEDGEARAGRAPSGPRDNRPQPTLEDLPLQDSYLRFQSIAASGSRPLLLPDASAVYYSSSAGTFRHPWNGPAQRIADSVSLRGMTPKGERIFYVGNAGSGGGRAGPGTPPGTPPATPAPTPAPTPGRGGGGGGGAGNQGGFFETSGQRANQPKGFNPSDRLHVDLAEMNQRKFLELARTLGDQFYHPTMKDLAWGELTKQYLPLARAARTPDEFEHVSMKLLGELNGSHLGVSAARPTPFADTGSARQSFGHLGVRTEPIDDGFEVKDVLETGPAGRGPMRLMTGDVITHVELEPVDANKPLEIQLADRVGREIVLGVRRNAQSLDLLITPVSYGAISGLSYDHWRNEANRRVEEMSNGRLGYIHIRGMDEGSLDTFVRDLYAAAEGKDGLVIDVRNNGGGWTTDRLLASIMYPRHAYTIPRGLQDSFQANRAGPEGGGYPNDRLFIPRYDLPINMLCNEKSFSNAEIISHAFKTLKRGTLVGEQTAGGVISTGGFRLVDGTSVRLPFRGWYLPDGTDMENHGAMPDVRVEQTPEAESANKDEQLEAAVKDLLARLPAKQEQAKAAE